MTSKGEKLNLLVATYIEPEYIERIREVDDRLNVIYEPSLIPTPRYAGDHTGHPLTRSPEQERYWLEFRLKCEEQVVASHFCSHLL